MEISEAIKTAITTMGVNIQTRPDLFSGMIMDMCSDQNAAKLVRVSCQHGILKYVLELVESKDKNTSSLIAHQARTMLINEYFMDQDNATRCVNYYLCALGLEKMSDGIPSTSFNTKSQTGSKAMISEIAQQKEYSTNIIQLRNQAKSDDISATIQLGDYYLLRNWRMAEAEYNKAIELANTAKNELLQKKAEERLVKLHNDYREIIDEIIF